MTAIELFLVIAVSIHFGWFLNRAWTAYQNEKLFKKIMVEIDREERVKTVVDKVFKHCYTERTEGQVYLYDFENCKFLGQGKTLKDISMNLKDQGVQVAFVQDGDTDVWLNNGKVLPVEE